MFSPIHDTIPSESLCENTPAQRTDETNLENTPTDRVCCKNLVVDDPLPTELGKQLYPVKTYNIVNLIDIFLGNLLDRRRLVPSR